MNTPVNCRYFYGDYHRGKNLEECRLIKSTHGDARPWKRKLCDSCPVPELIITSNSRDLILEAEVKRSFFREHVEVTFSVCGKHMTELSDGKNCPQCALE